MDGKYQVVIAPSVLDAVDNTLRYLIDTYGAQTAARTLYCNWKEAIERVACFPYAMAKVSNTSIAMDGKEYRKFLVGNFITIYHIDEENKRIQLMAFRYAPSGLGDTI